MSARKRRPTKMENELKTRVLQLEAAIKSKDDSIDYHLDNLEAFKTQLRQEADLREQSNRNTLVDMRQKLFESTSYEGDCKNALVSAITTVARAIIK